MLQGFRVGPRCMRGPLSSIFMQHVFQRCLNDVTIDVKGAGRGGGVPSGDWLNNTEALLRFDDQMMLVMPSLFSLCVSFSLCLSISLSLYFFLSLSLYFSLSLSRYFSLSLSRSLAVSLSLSLSISLSLSP